jgi:hypothetical protein
MKYIFCLVLFFQSVFCFANSASPFFSAGTNSGSAYTSKDVDILKETIVLDLEKKPHSAFYTITYHIRTDKDGKQIPLLFNAMGYGGGFKVWVDSKPVNILTIPRNSADSLRAILKDFGDVYHQSAKNNDGLNNSQTDTIFSDYKYFEVPLSKGVHIIKVEYIALPAGMHETWVNRYDFDYSLWPASYWRSFGSLEIVLHADTVNKQIETNLGSPSKAMGDTLLWNFDKLPTNVFRVSYTPKLGWYSSLMVGFGPFGFTICFTVLLVVVNAALIKRERRNSTSWFTWSAGIFGLVMPVFIFIAYFYSFDMIYAIIGDEASHHNNSVYVVFLYPVVAIAYFIIISITDQVIRHGNSKKATQKRNIIQGRSPSDPS